MEDLIWGNVDDMIRRYDIDGFPWDCQTWDGRRRSAVANKNCVQ